MSRRISLFLALVNFLAAPILFAADPQNLNERLQRIGLMSPVEREHLNRNIQEFSSLGEAEKSRLRDLYQKLQSERVHHGNGLFQLMQTYSVWLETLSPIQRDELRLEKDTAKKLAIIRRIKE